MSKETLLEEATIRKMMKLANIEPLANNFLDKETLEEEKAGRMDRKDVANKATGRWLKEEEELEEGAAGAYDRDEEELGDLGEPAPPEVGPEDLDPAPDDGPVDVVSLVDAIADAIESETGVSVDVDGGGEEPGLEEPLDDEEPLDAAPEGEDLMEDDVEEDLAAANITLEEDDDLINEITRRVARRLLRESAKTS